MYAFTTMHVLESHNANTTKQQQRAHHRCFPCTGTRLSADCKRTPRRRRQCATYTRRKRGFLNAQLGSWPRNPSRHIMTQQDCTPDRTQEVQLPARAEHKGSQSHQPQHLKPVRQTEHNEGSASSKGRTQRFTIPSGM